LIEKLANVANVSALDHYAPKEEWLCWIQIAIKISVLLRNANVQRFNSLH